MYKCPSCKMFASLSPGTCFKCGATLVDVDRPQQVLRLRRTIPYDGESDVVRRARRFLEKLRLVRMKQDSCPGTGHFAAGRAAVDGVIRLGFSGTIEVIYGNDEDSLRNMPLCYEQFERGGVDVVGPAGNRVRVEYVCLRDVHRLGLMNALQATQQFFQNRGRAMLGVYGASDGYGAEDDGLPWSSPAAGLNTRFAIVLQPFAWNQVRMVEDAATDYREQILKKSLASYIIDVPDPVAQLPPYQRSEPQIARAFQTFVTANGGTVDATVLRTVAAALSQAVCGRCHLMPVYGLHANYPGERTLNTLVRAVHALRKRGAIEGPVVIFNIRGNYDLDLESRRWSTPLAANGARAAEEITEPLDRILVVRSPGLPTALFQQLASRATLPMLLEGANTTNLCLQLGVPFLAVSNNASIPTLDEDGARGHVALRALTEFLWGKQRATDEQVEELADVIRDSITPETELFKYFFRLHQLVRAPEGDQLAFALAKLDERLERRGEHLPDVAPLVPVQQAVASPEVLTLRLRAREPSDSVVYTCPSCRKFGRVSPGTCPRCGARLTATG